ncbi:hypothetical protein M0811_03681 [Anaeramoeba ignava]|uniref:BTB domain-containing protein n=1 Tax=Anaeramoeba ignava TaxID=1746090 RepID=A0A9Q0LWM6_ANAIG|nr:hypothetical protein M0811_03681 [Anaeramoeba ignava]
MQSQINLIDLANDFRSIRERSLGNPTVIVKLKEGEKKETEVKIHKEFLRFQCPELINNADEKSNDEIKIDLSKISRKTGDDIINYIYTGEIEITEENIEEIIRAIEILENNQQLEFWCEDFIQESLTTENVLEYLQNSWVKKNEVLFPALMTFLQNNLSHLIYNNRKQIYKLGEDIIAHIFESDNLNLNSESDLLLLLVNFSICKSDKNGKPYKNISRKRTRIVPEKAYEFLKKYYKKIRFGLMSKNELEVLRSFNFDFIKDEIQDFEKYSNALNLLPWISTQSGNKEENDKQKKRQTDIMDEIKKKRTDFNFESRKFDPEIKFTPKSNPSKEKIYNYKYLDEVLEELSKNNIFQVKENFGNYKLAFSTSLHGWSISELHERCKNIEGSWFVVVTTENDDTIFAYSTSDYFNDENTFRINDTNSFIAILYTKLRTGTKDSQNTKIIKKQKTRLKSGSLKDFCFLRLVQREHNKGNPQALLYSRTYGPIFGDYDFGISSNLKVCTTNWGSEYLPISLLHNDGTPMSSFPSGYRFWDKWAEETSNENPAEKQSTKNRMAEFYSQNRHKVIDLQVFGKSLKKAESHN